jgi:NAD(P)-dependent dehydrogenase (short-subunit alcohol dehydrogenase family)
MDYSRGGCSILLFAGIGKAAVEEFAQLGASVLTCCEHRLAPVLARKVRYKLQGMIGQRMGCKLKPLQMM